MWKPILAFFGIIVGDVKLSEWDLIDHRTLPQKKLFSKPKQ